MDLHRPPSAISLRPFPMSDPLIYSIRVGVTRQFKLLFDQWYPILSYFILLKVGLVISDRIVFKKSSWRKRILHCNRRFFTWRFDMPSRLLYWSDNYHVVRIKSTWSYLHLKEAMVKNKHKSDHFYAHVVYRHHYHHHNNQYWRNQQQQIPSSSRSNNSISSGFGAIHVRKQ